MNTHTLRVAAPAWRRTILAASLLLAFGAAGAQTASERADAMRKDLYTLDSTVSFGLGYVSDDNRRFGAYRGLNDKGAYGLLDLGVVKRDEATGTWLKLQGKDLGLDARELRLTHERQGDWAYTIQGIQWTHLDPLVVHTGLQGIGTASQVVSATAPKRDIDLRIDRDILSLGVRKFLVRGYEVQIGFSQEEQNGDRLFGRGAGNVMEFLAEPIDRTTRQWNVLVGRAEPKFQWSAGYNGSSYDNHIPVLNTTGGNSAASAFGPLWAIALPPSNHAHQLHVAGGYNLSDTARTSFKLSRTVALQNETFDPSFARMAGAPDSLHGKVVTTLANVDYGARPLSRLDVHANVRYEERDDQTPEVPYIPSSAPTVGGSFTSAGVTGLYKPRSLKQLKGSVEGVWRFDGGYKAVASVEEEEMHRKASRTFRRVGGRERTDETTARVELKRMGSETLNGAIAYARSQRVGSAYIPDTFDPNALTNQVGALLWADRTRDKLRLSADWVPQERWSVQLLADASQDKYSGRPLGPREGNATFVSLDGTYKINEQWNATAWASREDTRAHQSARSDRVGSVALGFDTLWDADLRYDTRAAGFGVRGKARANLDVGADVSASIDKVYNHQRKVGGTGTAPVNSLPDMFYKQRGFKLFADWALQPMSGIRVELLIDRRRTNDWTWENWVYNGAPAIAASARNSDGTRVTNVPRENVAVVGIVYRYRWR